MKFAEYRKQIIVTMIGVMVPGLFAFTGWAGKSYADQNYVQLDELDAKMIHRELDQVNEQVEDYDDDLFEIEQEIMLEDDDSVKSKWEARKAYYQRKKEDKLREREELLQELEEEE